MGAPGILIDEILPHHDARTVQERVVDADPARTYEAIWQADLVSSPLTRTLLTVARLPARRGDTPAPTGDRHWRLARALDEDDPWILVGERTGSEVVLGLLWTPPAGGTGVAGPRGDVDPAASAASACPSEAKRCCRRTGEQDLAAADAAHPRAGRQRRRAAQLRARPGGRAAESTLGGRARRAHQSDPGAADRVRAPGRVVLRAGAAPVRVEYGVTRRHSTVACGQVQT